MTFTLPPQRTRFLSNLEHTSSLCPRSGLSLDLPPRPFLSASTHSLQFLSTTCTSVLTDSGDRRLHRANFLSAAHHWHSFNYCRDRGGRHGLSALKPRSVWSLSCCPRGCRRVRRGGLVPVIFYSFYTGIS